MRYPDWLRCAQLGRKKRSLSTASAKPSLRDIACYHRLVASVIFAALGLLAVVGDKGFYHGLGFQLIDTIAAMARKLEEMGHSDTAFAPRENFELSIYLKELMIGFLSSCELILSEHDNEEIFFAESAADRPKNDCCIPVDRADNPVINRFCRKTPRNRDRIPSTNDTRLT